MMSVLYQDLKFAGRMLARSPGFTAGVVISLALGIGANSAIFSIVNSVLFRPLPFAEPDTLVWIWSTRTDRDKAFFSIPDFVDYRAQTRSLKQMATFANWGANLTDQGEPERLQGVRVTPDAFRMLGVEAIAGRTLLPEDARPGSPRVVVLTHGLWQRRFGGERDLIGTSLHLNGDPYIVVGVLPPSFLFPGTEAEAEIAVPLVPETDPRRTERGSNFLRVFARLEPGATRAQAQAELAGIARRLRDQYPETNAKHTAPRVLALHQEIVGDYRMALLMLLGAVGLVLMIACTNIANLLLVRSSAREKEFALRTALGAGRARLVRQLLTESVLLALSGGAAALLLGSWGLDLLLALGPSSLPRAREIGLDGMALWFTFGVSIMSGLIFGLVPAIQASRIDLNEGLKGAARGLTEGRGHHRTRALLVILQVATSLVLLIGAGLFLKSFRRLQSVSPGFETENLLLVRLSLPEARYGRPQDVTVFYDKLASAFEGMPGVRSIAMASVLPMSGMNARTDFTIVGRPPMTAAEVPAAQNRWVSPGYFKLMGIPLVKGREFSLQDNERVRGVVVVDEALARRFWPDGEPLGAHLEIDDGVEGPRAVEIVGVAGDVKHVGLDDEPTPTLYAPLAQVPVGTVSFLTGRLNLVVRTAADPLALAASVRREVHAVDGQVPASNVRSMEQVLAATVAPRRFNLLLLWIFGGAALLLATSGLYAVISFSVARRTREIGIRMALGARNSDVLRLVMGQGVRMILIGVALGLGGALASTRLVSSMLYGVSAFDPTTFAFVSLLFAGVAMLAGFVPARRATRVDPTIALRRE